MLGIQRYELRAVGLQGPWVCLTEPFRTPCRRETYTPPPLRISVDRQAHVNTMVQDKRKSKVQNNRETPKKWTLLWIDSYVSLSNPFMYTSSPYFCGQTGTCEYHGSRQEEKHNTKQLGNPPKNEHFCGQAHICHSPIHSCTHQLRISEEQAHVNTMV